MTLTKITSLCFLLCCSCSTSTGWQDSHQFADDSPILHDPFHDAPDVQSVLDELLSEDQPKSDDLIGDIKSLMSGNNKSPENPPMTLDILKDLQSILTAKDDSSSPITVQDSQRAHRNKITIDCGKYGCCKDGKTPADSLGKWGCALKICADVQVGTCLKKFEANTLDCSNPLYKRICPYSCSRCKPAAAPISACMRRNPLHGCCWDGRLALGMNGQGCRPCDDDYPHTCKVFSKISRGCHSGSWGIRHFMTSHCPRRCRQCLHGKA